MLWVTISPSNGMGRPSVLSLRSLMTKAAPMSKRFFDCSAPHPVSSGAAAVLHHWVDAY